MKNIKNKLIIMTAALVAVCGLATFTPSYVGASPADSIDKGIEGVGGKDDGGDLGTQIKKIVNLLLYILGAIAVVMIVIGGIRYATSNGDSSALTSAKNTILYAVVGLVVAMLAFAIVNFVILSFK